MKPRRFFRKKDVERLLQVYHAARLEACPVDPYAQLAMRGYLNLRVADPVLQVLKERGFIQEVAISGGVAGGFAPDRASADPARTDDGGQQ